MKKIKVLAILAAIITAVAMSIFLKQAQGENIQINETFKNIAIANTNLEANTVVTEEQINIIAVPEKGVHADSIENMDDIIGKYVLSDIYEGEQIISSKLIDINDSENITYGLAYSLEAGKRALSFNVEFDTGVSGLIKIGNKVDILMLANKGNQTQSSEFISKYVVQNAKVLALDSTITKGNEIAYSTITIELTPEDALDFELQKLYALNNEGSFHVVLRSQFDNGTEDKILTIQ